MAPVLNYSWCSGTALSFGLGTHCSLDKYIDNSTCRCKGPWVPLVLPPGLAFLSRGVVHATSHSPQVGVTVISGPWCISAGLAGLPTSGNHVKGVCCL